MNYFAPRRGKKIAPAQTISAVRRKKRLPRAAILSTLLAPIGLAGGMAGAALLGNKSAGNGARPALRSVPFVRAAYKHVEPAFDVSQAVGAGAVQLGPFDVPAHGFVRHIWLLVTGTLGDLTAGVLSQDYPFVLLDEVALLDVNGAPIYGPTTGYDLYVANLHGGYAWDSDATALPDYVATINCNFVLRIPVEITPWDGFGALANQNASAPYRIHLRLAASATAFSTAPTTAPTIRVRGYLESWTQPTPADATGAPQEQMPPGHPTTQYWSVYSRDVSAAENTIVINRVGNWLRNLIFIYRDDATPRARTTTEFPDPIRINLDGRQLLNEPRQYRRVLNRETTHVAPITGVFSYGFTDDQDGHGGYENRDLWLPTVQATRLELVGTFGGSGGQLRVLTNDVAPAIAGMR